MNLLLLRLITNIHSRGFPTAAGLRAHIELCRITGFIVCNVYRIAPWDQSHKTTMQHVEQALQRLRDWHASLPPVLRIDYNNLGQDRARCTLHLAYHQVSITSPAVLVSHGKNRLIDTLILRM